MCGIYGIASPAGAPLASVSRLDAMAGTLAHRGPNGHARFGRPHAMLGAHRLRIVDLEPRADQPFADHAERLWLVCNGEIYNAPDLKRRFTDYPYRSASDVEVILPLYHTEGLEAFDHLIGMFALALWDEGRRRLVLARDRAGEKPLFYTRGEQEVRFASEIQALLALPDADRTLDRTALAGYLRLGAVPQPRTLFSDIRAVEPGTAEVFGPTGQRSLRFWHPSRLVGNEHPPDATAQVAARVETAVRRQLLSDVPIGVFASGGVDSSLLLKLAAESLGPEKVTAFTAGFQAASYDESAYAARITHALGTSYQRVIVGERALADAFDTVASRIAEPIADPAVLPTLLLARAARERVGVVLVGEGADELFGGYPTYLGHMLAPHFASLPPVLRHAAGTVLRRLPVSNRKVAVAWLARRFVEGAEQPWLRRHLAWFGSGLAAAVLGESWRGDGAVGDWADGAAPVERAEQDAAFGAGEAAQVGDDAPGGVLSAAMLFDYQVFLRDRLLVKLDRASMLASLEARAPYLDPDLTAYALSLAPDQKVRPLTTKWLLKRVAARHLPGAIIRRRKRGLSVPIAGWVNGGLAREVDRVLEPARLRRQGLLSDVYVRRLLAAHRAGAVDAARPLWTLIVLQHWLEHWLPEALA